MSHPTQKDYDDLEEQLRRAKEVILETQLQAQNNLFLAGQTATSLRWWAVVYLMWMVREAAEPARYAFSYPTSWAYKIADMTAHPSILVVWFSVATVLIIPLIFFLIFEPDGYMSHKSQDWALCGLGGAGLGYAYLASAAMRLDVPHVADSYVGSTIMLTITALLVACWHNARIVRKVKDKPTEQYDKDMTCTAIGQ